MGAFEERLQRAKRIVFFTGAGMSAESGVPTFRGKGGMWSQYNYEEYACQEAFERDPEKVWDFHEMRREMVAACAPHAGHEAITAFQKARPGVVSIITQNIDGMHQKAGSTDVVEMHGSLWGFRHDPSQTKETFREVPIPSRKHPSGDYWRPDIVWFGDSLDGDVLARAQKLARQSDLFFCIGTSGVVFPAALIPLEAQKHGATLVEINPEDSDLSPYCDICLRGGAAQLLPALLDPSAA